MCLLKIVSEKNDILFQNVAEIKFSDNKIIAFDMLRRKKEFTGVIHTIDADQSIVSIGLRETVK